MSAEDGPEVVSGHWRGPGHDEVTEAREERAGVIRVQQSSEVDADLPFPRENIGRDELGGVSPMPPMPSVSTAIGQTASSASVARDSPGRPSALRPPRSGLRTVTIVSRPKGSVHGGNRTPPRRAATRAKAAWAPDPARTSRSTLSTTTTIMHPPDRQAEMSTRPAPRRRVARRPRPRRSCGALGTTD